MVATSFRQNLRTGCYSVLTTYMAANPTKLVAVFDHPPESFPTPCAYVEKKVSEKITHTAGVRFRVMTINVMVVNKLMSNDQATDEQDVLVDGLVDAFSAAPNAAGAATLMEPQGADDVELTAGEGVRYAGAVITVEATIQEGRD